MKMMVMKMMWVAVMLAFGKTTATGEEGHSDTESTDIPVEMMTKKLTDEVYIKNTSSDGSVTVSLRGCNLTIVASDLEEDWQPIILQVIKKKDPMEENITRVKVGCKVVDCVETTETELTVIKSSQMMVAIGWNPQQSDDAGPEFGNPTNKKTYFTTRRSKQEAAAPPCQADYNPEAWKCLSITFIVLFIALLLVFVVISVFLYVRRCEKLPRRDHHALGGVENSVTSVNLEHNSARHCNQPTPATGTSATFVSYVNKHPPRSNKLSLSASTDETERSTSNLPPMPTSPAPRPPGSPDYPLMDGLQLPGMMGNREHASHGFTDKTDPDQLYKKPSPSVIPKLRPPPPSTVDTMTPRITSSVGTKKFLQPSIKNGGDDGGHDHEVDDDGDDKGVSNHDYNDNNDDDDDDDDDDHDYDYIDINKMKDQMEKEKQEEKGKKIMPEINSPTESAVLTSHDSENSLYESISTVCPTKIQQI